MKISVNLYTAEHCSQGQIEGQLLIVGDTVCIIPLENRMPTDLEWTRLLEFDGHHLTQGDYDGPLWVDEKTVKFSRTVEVEI